MLNICRLNRYLSKHSNRWDLTEFVIVLLIGIAKKCCVEIVNLTMWLLIATCTQKETKLKTVMRELT